MTKHRTAVARVTAILFLAAMALPALGASERPDMQRESARIVSQHKAVFTRPPIGASTYTTDAILLGNGDLAMAISSTPLPRDSKLKAQFPEKIRFWFTKNDLWTLGGRTSSKLFAVMDFSFRFDRRKSPESTYRVETDLHTATTRGTISVASGPTLKFTAWVSAVEDMMFIEFASEGKTAIRWEVETHLMRDDSAWEMRGFRGEDILYMRREFTRGTPPTGMSMCVKKFGKGRRFHLTEGGPRLFAFAVDSLSQNPGYPESLTTLRASGHDTTYRLDPNPDYAKSVVKTMAAFDPADLAKKYAAHKAWWAAFWAESFVEIPDKAVEKQYYLANYVLASSCRNKDFPPGIVTPWVGTDRPGWSNDYHLNYNFQAAFYSLYGSNHVALGEVQDQPLLDYMPKGRELAKERLNKPGNLNPLGIGPKGATT